MDELGKRLDGLDLHFILIVSQQIVENAYQIHVSHFLPKGFDQLFKVESQTVSDFPALVFGGLDQNRQNVGFIKIIRKDRNDRFEGVQ